MARNETGGADNDSAEKSCSHSYAAGSGFKAPWSHFFIEIESHCTGVYIFLVRVRLLEQHLELAQNG